MHDHRPTFVRQCLRRPLKPSHIERRSGLPRPRALLGIADARLAYLLAAERLEDSTAEAQTALYRLAAAENKPLAQLQRELGLS
jgi:hypothetical protein